MYPDFDPDRTKTVWGISKSTLWNILKFQDKIMNAAENLPSFTKSERTGKFAETEQELFSWIRTCNSQGSKVSSKDIITKTKELNSQIKCSSGWLQNFKRRFNIKYDKLMDSYFALKLE